MKKLLPFFGALALVLTSCSSDDSNDDATASVKPSKIAFSYSNSDYDYSIDIKYDGNKVVSETEDTGYTTKYTYTGDVITKIEYFNEEKQLESTVEYTYTAGKVSSQSIKYAESQELKSTSSGYYRKVKYTYNTDNTVFFERFYVYTDGSEEKTGDSGTYTYKDGNVVKSVMTSGGSTTTYDYEYDAKSNPLKNVTGGALLIDRGYYASANNITQQSGNSTEIIYTKFAPLSHSAKRAALAANGYSKTFTYTYDANNFPTEQKSFDSEATLTQTVKYTY